MRAYYTDEFVLPLPAGHRFPMDKYRRLRERCVAEGVLSDADLLQPAPAAWADLGLVHTPSYLANVRRGELTAQEQRAIGFPWSEGMVERSRRSVGATIEAARTALDERGATGWGVSVNLAGGTHHSYADRGGGFCVFNDAAVATRVFQAEGRVERVAVIDCDVHQGNGTAAIFAADPSVLTFSMHGARNYPFHRERSTIDIELADGTGDLDYLRALELAMPRVVERFRPDLVIYLAGADPFEGDRLGRLGLSKAGLARRDDIVLGWCAEAGIPLVVTMAGGYGVDTADTVDIHLATVRNCVRWSREMASSLELPSAPRVAS